ncbi:MAG TPA: hypothetical protein VLA72_13435, partial [Anaerolineales bacterium]|nr:hypothetical protein [Anaerolineales bacterium]
CLFDNERSIKKAQAITAGILQARSCRLSDIAREMAGSEAANYKCIQRFVAQTVLKPNLLRLYQEEAPFLIGDPTEMPRPEAQKTDYVGTLSDGKTSGYWLLLLATPYQGRAMPCHFVSYSSAILGSEVTSRNRYHYQAFAEVKELLGEKPLVLDREFSYLGLMQALVSEEDNFVIRLPLLRSGRQAGGTYCQKRRDAYPQQGILYGQGLGECDRSMANRSERALMGDDQSAR